MGVHNLLLQQVFLVQEENGGGFFKPLGGEDGLEQGQALLESILRVSSVSHNTVFVISKVSQSLSDEIDGVRARALRHSHSRTGPGRTR